MREKACIFPFIYPQKVNKQNQRWCEWVTCSKGKVIKKTKGKLSFNSVYLFREGEYSNLEGTEWTSGL